MIKARFFYLLRIVYTFVENNINRIRLKNDNFTILCSTCAGGVIYHKLGKKFLSPTVNLWMREMDLYKFACNLRYYQESKLSFIETNYPYPVAKLNDITIYFNHAANVEAAKTQWYSRINRINPNNLFVIASDNGLSYEQIKIFGNLKCNGLVVFTSKNYPELHYTLQLKYKENEETVGIYMSDHTKVLDKFKFELYFDYVKWLNTGKLK